MYVIKIPCSNNKFFYYKSIWKGDPGRTPNKKIATKFGKKKSCIKHIEKLRLKYPTIEFILDVF